MASTPDVAFPADQPSTGRALIPSHQLCSNESRIGSSVFNQSRMVRCVQLIAIPIYCFSTSSILEEKGCLRQSTYHASYAFLLLTLLPNDASQLDIMEKMRSGQCQNINMRRLKITKPVSVQVLCYIACILSFPVAKLFTIMKLKALLHG